MRYARQLAVLCSVAVGVAAAMSMGPQALTDLARDTPERPKVVLVVVDGADWTPINQLRNRSRLPHVSRMMREGVYGDTITPVAFSPITWTKIGTGQKASDLRVDGWNVEDEDGGMRMIQSSDVRHKRIWDYLNAAGVSTGVTNFFLTWPVEPVDGFMIAVAAALEEEDLVYPAGAVPDDVLETADEWRIARYVESRYGERHPFYTYGFKRLDAIQHSLWKFVVPDRFGISLDASEERYREVVYTEYERLDEFLSRFGPEWNVIVVSDSGFEAEGGYEAETLAQFRAREVSRGHVYPTYEGNLNPLLRELGYTSYTTRRVMGETVREIDTRPSELRWCPLDYPKPSYLNETAYLFRFCVEDSSLPVNAVIDHLSQVRYRNGKHFFEDVRYDPESNSIVGRWRLFSSGVVNTSVRESFSHQPTFHGKLVEVHKELGLRLPDGTSYDLDIGPEKSGDHPAGTDGIFIARGPAIRDAGKMSPHTVSAADIAPTILYMYNLSVPLGMEGDVVTSLFTPTFNDARHVVRANISTRRSGPAPADANQSHAAAIRQRLKGLGYLN